MALKPMVIGTRGSKLALWQAKFTQRQLADIGQDTRLKIIKTKGDKIQHLSFDKLEGKGFFTKELEEALLAKEIDLAVHSMKDLPTTSPPGLCITAVSYREDPADWLIIRREVCNKKLPFRLPVNATIGTSSARRKAQLLNFRKDINLKDIRGNVPTRIKKLHQGDFDAIMLAAAGIKRLELDLSPFEVIRLHPREMIPAPAQGVLAYQVRIEDRALRTVLRQIHHPEVSEITNVERKVLQLLAGGCQMPLGVYCEKDKSQNFHVWAAKAERWNGPVTHISHSSSTRHNLPEAVVEQLLQASKQLDGI